MCITIDLYHTNYFFYLEHSVALDVDKMNREKIDADCNLWDALESSKWLPCDMLEVA